MESVPELPLAVVVATVTAAAAMDLWKFRLPNALTIPFFILGVLYHALTTGTETLGASGLGAVVGSAQLIPLYAYRGMGAGDVKLAAGIGAWLGAWHVLHVLIIAGLATGVYSAGIAIWNRRRHMPGQIPNEPFEEERLSRDQAEPVRDITTVVRLTDARRRVVPFGAMLALGVVGTIMWIGN